MQTVSPSISANGTPVVPAERGIDHTRPLPAAPTRRPLRISLVVSSLWLSGGVMVVIEVANRLAERGHAVCIVAPGESTAPAMAAMVAPAVCVRESRVPRKPSEGLGDHVGLALSLARCVPQSDVIVSTHTPTTAPALFARLQQPPARLVWLFMDTEEMFVGRPVEAWLMRNALRWHEAALAISQATAAELRTVSPYRTADAVRVVGMALSHLEQLTPSPFAARPANQPRVLLYVGDDRPRKGMADFLAAAALLADQGFALRLEIVSRTPCVVASEVPFTLRIAAETEILVRLLQSSDCYVMASWKEGLGNLPLEAMACATPVVLTAAGGPAEYARDVENCLVVPPGNPAALAQAIGRVLSSAALAERLSRAGPDTAATYRWEPVINRVEAALLEICARPSPRRWPRDARR